MRVVVAPDKFRGTVTAAQAASALAVALRAAGHEVVEVPMADGGEGTLDALGGANRSTVVSGPLGDPVEAEWRLSGRRAVIEMARASGLALVGGAEGNDPVAASTHGTGELIAAALDLRADDIVVCVGGSATTDGGLGALRALYPVHRLRGVRLTVACDVRIAFVDAAERFAPQKGATPAQVELLRRRLERLEQVYLDEYGVDVADLEGAGAAGGLAGGLACVGAELVEGVEVVAERLGLEDAIESADAVLTGEGHLDAESFDGKVVGGVADLAAHLGVPVAAVVGAADADVAGSLPVLALTDRFGDDVARSDTERCLTEVAADALAAALAAGPGQPRS
ncbi:MAG: glycerate kinase [Microthrixaceae bacterium]